MINLRKKVAILAISFMSFLGIQSASAVEGLSIGIALNTAAFMGSGKETETGSGGDATKITITEEDGAFKKDGIASIFVEYAANDLFTLGIERFADDVSTPTNLNVQQPTAGADINNTVKATFKDHTTVYANVNMPFGTYLKLGYHMVDILTQESLATGGKYNDVDTNGISVGLGYQYTADNGVFIRAEVSASEYDDVDATNTVDSSKVVEVKEMYGAVGALKIGKSF